MAPSNQPMYAKDEKALCFHMDLLYEAKVIEVKPTDPNDKKSAFEYKVHYKGWKNTWDDWVPQDRLRKLTDENKELAATLKRDAMRRQSKPTPTSHKKKAGESLRGSEERHSSVTATLPRGQKRGRDYEIEKEEQYLSRPSIRIVIPDRLKSLLVDDWEYVTKNQQIPSVPAKIPVSQILDEYFEAESKHRLQGTPDYEIFEEVISGLKDYFNAALGRVLLYRFERPRFAEILKEMEDPTSELAGKKVVEIFPGEYLLRLFCSLPELIAQTNLDQQSCTRLREELSKLSMWLSKNQQVDRYFTAEYENPTQEYLDKAKAGIF